MIFQSSRWPKNKTRHKNSDKKIVQERLLRRQLQHTRLWGRSWGALGCYWALLGRSWGAPGRSWGSFGVILGALGALLGRSGALLGRSGAAAGVPGVLLGAPGAPWERFARLLGAFLVDTGVVGGFFWMAVSSLGLDSLLLYGAWICQLVVALAAGWQFFFAR